MRVARSTHAAANIAWCSHTPCAANVGTREGNKNETKTKSIHTRVSTRIPNKTPKAPALFVSFRLSIAKRIKRNMFVEEIEGPLTEGRRRSFQVGNWLCVIS